MYTHVWPYGESFTNYVSFLWIEVVQPCVSGMPAFKVKYVNHSFEHTHRSDLVWSSLVSSVLADTYPRI